MPDFRVLVVFHTSEGHTAKVAGRIAARLRDAGVHVDLAGADDAPHPGGYDGVVIADPVHFTRQSKAVVNFVRRYAEELESTASAFVQVSLAAQSDYGDDQRSLRVVSDKATIGLGWRPDVLLQVAGALPYTQYGWLKKSAMRRIVAKRGGDTDTSRDHEYTDWDALDTFADEFAELLRKRRD
jgi:menaquinone-dependent protoporphyrinogen oxidase